jgi:2-amino-4-hydroxy-6-hydroxymethyldihydropteridine diphosphokinase/dihydropteroate synthase
MLVGPSRKSFLGKITGRAEPADRDAATVAAAVACVASGGLADIVRVHNVKDVRDGIAVADALFRADSM